MAASATPSCVAWGEMRGGRAKRGLMCTALLPAHTVGGEDMGTEGHGAGAPMHAAAAPATQGCAAEPTTPPQATHSRGRARSRGGAAHNTRTSVCRLCAARGAAPPHLPPPPAPAAPAAPAAAAAAPPPRPLCDPPQTAGRLSPARQHCPAAGGGAAAPAACCCAWGGWARSSGWCSGG